MSFLGNRMVKYFLHHSKICIIGGGAGGVNLSAHLLRSKVDPSDVCIFQPRQHHYYQPGWTFVGAGKLSLQATKGQMEKIIPDKVNVVKESVKLIQPQKNLIITDRNHQYTYEQLIISSGFIQNWQEIKGARELLQDPTSNVCSVYNYKYADKTASLGKRFHGGKAIFTQPKLPIKCAGAPMKIAFLWNTEWKKQLVKGFQVEIIKAQPTMFMVPKYAQAIQKLTKKKEIMVTLQHNLIEVTREKAIFEHVLSKQKMEKEYDFLHLVPPMSPPSFISQSGLGNEAGFVDVDDHTLQHKKYPNIWSLGDSSILPTSKTCAAIFSQTLVLVKNLLAVLKSSNQKQLPGSYNGYTACPLAVGGKKAMLAEFLYDKKVSESFFSNQEKPRFIFYLMTKYMFPFVYWKLMPRGLWKGRDGLRWGEKL